MPQLARSEKLLSSFRRDESGNAIIEYAVTLPVLFLFIFGTLEFAIVLYLRGTIEESTRQAARHSITGSVYGADQSRSEYILATLQNQIGNIVFKPSNLSIHTSVYDTYINFNSNADSVSGDAVTNSAAFGAPNQIVRYTVNYEHEFLTPIAFMANGMDNTLMIQSTVFAKNEDF